MPECTKAGIATVGTLIGIKRPMRTGWSKLMADPARGAAELRTGAPMTCRMG
jgi:hypothetical protein